MLAGAGAGVTLASGNGGKGKATAAGGGQPRGMHRRHGKQGAGGKAGVFHTVCTYSHSANDDPILMPGKPGASMLHDFFGNGNTNASSTASKLIGGPTTCATGADASGYWTPALYDNGRRVIPSRVATYWLGASRRGPTTPLPAGLQMIAGNEQATSPQPADHVSRLSLHIHYPNSPSGKFMLSMGPGMQGSIYSEHADFLDGWNTSVLNRLTTTCLDTHSKCGKVTGPNGTPHPVMGSTSSSS